ncbi:MAG TPA: methyltransferase domain-containing protein [Bacteroidota bacterium]
MQLPSLIGHVQELLGAILASHLQGETQLRTPVKPADSLIDTFFRSRKYLGSHDRRFIAETAYGSLRHLRRSQTVLQSALTAAQQSVNDEDGILLTIAAYLVHIERREDITASVIEQKLNEPHLKDSIPFLLKQFAETNHLPATDDAERLGVEYSYPDWMAKKLIAQHGAQEAQKIMASLNEQAPLTLRVNTLKAEVEACQAALKKEGIETTRTPFSPVGLNVAKRFNIFGLTAFREGMFEVQDEGSQLLPLLIDPKPTAKVLDACAGAGGKTLALAAIMKNRGEIFATDVHDGRLEELRKRSKRAGVSNVRVKVISSVDDLTRAEEAEASRVGDFNGYFDVVLIDAPCTGLGTIRRNPGMKWSVTENTVRELSEKQSAILAQSAPLVKPGGRLVYATCTMLREENEDVVEGFLSKHTEFSVADVSASLEKLKLSSAVNGKYIRLQPHVHGTDGFFCAVLEKLGSRNL